MINRKLVSKILVLFVLFLGVFLVSSSEKAQAAGPDTCWTTWSSCVTACSENPLMTPSQKDTCRTNCLNTNQQCLDFEWMNITGVGYNHDPWAAPEIAFCDTARVYAGMCHFVEGDFDSYIQYLDCRAATGINYCL